MKKLKGTSNSANTSTGNTVSNLPSNHPSPSILRQQQQLTYQHLPNSSSTSQQHKFQSYHQLQTALQGTSVSSPFEGIRNDISIEAKSSLPNVAQTQLLSPPAPATPPSLASSSFSVTFPSKSSLIDNSLLHCNISQIPSQPPLCIFEDDEEPSNPLDQPPAELLAPTTSLPLSSLPNKANPSQNVESALSFDNIVLLAQQPPPPSNTNSSQQQPLAQQSNQGGQSTTYSHFNSITSPSPIVPDLLLSTPPGVHNTISNNSNGNNNNNSNNYNNNKKADKRPSSSTPTPTVSSVTVNHHSHQHPHNFQHNHSSHLLTSGTNASPTSSPSKRQKIKDNSSTKGLHSSSISRSISNSATSGLSIGQTATSILSTTSSITTSTSKRESTSHKFFNIHDRIKDHYLQLLANDLNLFAEAGVGL